MKKILSILLVSVLLIGCSENRILLDELINKGTVESPIMYVEKELFSGIGFNVYDNGQLMSEMDYKNGKKDGLYKVWYENGTFMNEVNYKNGLLEDGIVKYWSEDGDLKYEENFIDGKTVWLKEFFKNGQKYSTFDIKDGEKDGLYKQWNKDGQLISEINYKNGKKEGISKNWYDNGQLISEINYKNNVRDGLSKGWYENGDLSWTTNYKDGQLIYGGEEIK